MVSNSFLDTVRDWEGTAENLAAELQRGTIGLELPVEPPSVRTVRLWRLKRLLSNSRGAPFGFRQILEGLAISVLLGRGWSLVAIADLLPTLDHAALEARLISEGNSEAASWTSGLSDTSDPLSLTRRFTKEATEDAVILLAQGIIRQYDRILTGREIIRQDDGLPPELHSAMCKLGRLYIEAGQHDRAACVHDILARARYPFHSAEWNLDGFMHPDFRFRDAVLIDPDLRVPTVDCSALASASGGFGEDNVVEHRLHSELRDAAERLGSRRRHIAYTAVRELVGRRSLATELELARYLEERDLVPLQETILETLFDPVPDAWLFKGMAHRCAHCGTLLRPHSDFRQYPDGFCPIRQCRGKWPTQLGEKLDPARSRLLVARPQILTYWTGPAIDELAIFDEARRRGLEAALYPESDLCDVSIDVHAIGIDAKSYTSPVSLALRLNQGIGGLVNFRRRIIAIGDELIATNPDYLHIARSSLERKGDPATLEILPVSSVLSLLRSRLHA